MSISTLTDDTTPVGTEPGTEPDAVPTAHVDADELDILLSKAMPANQAKDTLSMMIYSTPGAGKTTLLGQIPNNFIVDTEQGRIVLAGQETAPGVQVLPFKSFYQGELLVNRLNQGDEKLDHIETLSIDTVSFLHKKGLEEVTEREWLKSPTLANRYKAETDGHTENNEHIRRLVANANSTGRNVVITAHSRTIEPKGELARTFPDFSEKLANTLAGMMDIVGYLYQAVLEDDEVHRVLMLRSNGQIQAKTRITTMPDQIIDPTWDKIWDYFQQFLKIAEKK